MHSKGTRRVARSANKSQEQAALSIQHQEFFSGPIPPASEVKQYEEALPGSGDRILAMAEKQGEHRRKLEVRAQIAGWILMLTALLGGIFLLAIGKPVGNIDGNLGTWSGGGLVLITLIVMFFWGWKGRR